MPNNVLPIGVAIGALSLVPTNYKFVPWTLYGGIPIKPLKKRNKTKIMKNYKTLHMTFNERN